MKISDLFNDINSVKPITKEKFLKWLNEAETLLYQKVFSMAADTDFDLPIYDNEVSETVLLVPVPYDDIYLFFIYAKIDSFNQEWDSYNNNITLYNNLYDGFAIYYRRNHIPKG